MRLFFILMFVCYAIAYIADRRDLENRINTQARKIWENKQKLWRMQMRVDGHDEDIARHAERVFPKRKQW